MVLVDICGQESIEFVLPYLNPMNTVPWRDNDDYGNWRVSLHAFAIQTLSTNTSDSVYYQVFASLDKPEASGYVQSTFALGHFQSGERARHLMDAGARVFARVDGQRLYDLGVALGGNAAAFVKTVSAGAALAKGGEAAYNYFTNDEAKFMQDVLDADKEIAAEDDFVEEEQRPMKLMLAADLSNTSGSVSKYYAILGDNKKVVTRHLPTRNTIYHIPSMCRIPTYYNTIELKNSTISTPAVVNFNPFSVDSHFRYLSKMFRFWRGGFHLLCCFVTASSASARVQATVYPVQSSVTPTSSDVGDLPTSIISVRGTENFAFHLPFISLTPWLSTQNYLSQSIVFTLSETIPAPYDKPVSVYIVMFVCGDDEIAFCSLCSARPALSGEFQSRTYPARYMGEIKDVRQILNRFSNRDPALGSTAFTNGPLEIKSFSTTPPSISQLDNFDYVSNLYHFFTGPTCQKVFFDGSTASGSIFVTLENPRSASYGSDTVCGNSLAITDQTVWPCIEYVVPYNSIYPYLDVFGSENNINTVYNYSAAITNYYISAGRGFRLMYTMPVPDFFLTDMPTQVPVNSVLPMQVEVATFAPEEGEFQSYTAIPRFNTRQVYTGNMPLSSSGPIVSRACDPFSDLSTTTWGYTLEAWSTDSSGATQVPLFCALADVDSGSFPTLFPNTAADCANHVVDFVAFSGVNDAFGTTSGFVSKKYGSSMYVVAGMDATVDGGWSGTVYFKLMYYPFSVGSVSVSPQFTSDSLNADYITNNVVTTLSGTPSVTISGTPTVSVSGTPTVSITGTPNVAVTNTPDVHVTSTVVTTVTPDTGSVFSTLVTNTSGQPVPVTASGDFPVAAQVMGVPGATTPVWVTNYPN
jgi:hypothetical protein